MPIQIDHDQRRQDVAQIAARVIAREGIEGLTIRAVAKEAGVSTKLVSHYFANKRALLIFTFRWIVESRRAGPAPVGGWTRESVREALRDRLPLGARKVELFRVWFAFWAAAASDPEYAAVQADEVQAAQAVWAERYRAVFGLSPAEADRMSWKAITLIYGLATQICFDATARLTPPAVMDALIEETLDGMLPPAKASSP